MRTSTRGRFAPLAQAPLPAFLLSFSFEFTFNLNFKKRRVAVTSPKPHQNLAEVSPNLSLYFCTGGYFFKKPNPQNFNKNIDFPKIEKIAKKRWFCSTFQMFILMFQNSRFWKLFWVLKIFEKLVMKMDIEVAILALRRCMKTCLMNFQSTCAKE